MTQSGRVLTPEGRVLTPEERPCPKCGHGDDDHARESWYDEEGVEGMTCQACEQDGRRCSWWTWDWREVLAESVVHEGEGSA